MRLKDPKLIENAFKKAAAYARRTKVDTIREYKEILKEHGLTQTKASVARLVKEMEAQDYPSYCGYYKGKFYVVQSWSRTIPEGWSRRDVCRAYKEIHYVRPDVPLHERLEQFRLCKFREQMLQLLIGVANWRLDLEVGDESDYLMITSFRLNGGWYSNHRPYTRWINVYKIVVPRHWRSRIYNRGLSGVVAKKLVLDATPIDDVPNAYKAVWIHRKRTKLLLECGVVLVDGGRIIHGANLAECRKRLTLLNKRLHSMSRG